MTMCPPFRKLHHKAKY